MKEKIVTTVEKAKFEKKRRNRILYENFNKYIEKFLSHIDDTYPDKMVKNMVNKAILDDDEDHIHFTIFNKFTPDETGELHYIVLNNKDFIEEVKEGILDMWKYHGFLKINIKKDILDMHDQIFISFYIELYW